MKLMMISWLYFNKIKGGQFIMLYAFDSIAEKAKQNIPINAEDYVVDGLLHCGKCHTPKQCRVEIFGEIREPYCLCQCETEKDEKMREEMRLQEIERKRLICFQEKEMMKCRFEADNKQGDQKAMAVFEKYAKNFDLMLKKHLGLLIYGDVGVGKSFAAACIANELIDKGYSCFTTNFIKINSELWSVPDKLEYINSLSSYDLIVIDDLGAERNTEYASEIVTNVIGNLCNAGKNLIVTTNLTPDDLINPKSTNNFKSDDEIIRKKRVFSRLFQMTVPVHYNGSERRKKIMENNFSDVKNILGL